MRRRAIQVEQYPQEGLQENTIFVDVPVARVTASGDLELPTPVEGVWIDVGMSFNAPNAVAWLQRNPQGFVIGFEPDYRMYLSYYAYAELSNNPWILGERDAGSEPALIERARILQRSGLDPHLTPGHLRPELFDRFLVFPAAVTQVNGYARLHHAHHHGSSSLDQRWVVESNVDVYGQKGLEVESKIVRSIPLAEVLTRLPPALDPLHHLKVDAEGLDHQVLLSAGTHLERFAVVTLEQPNDGFMKEYGFVPERQQMGGVSYRNKRYHDLEVDYAIFV